MKRCRVDECGVELIIGENWLACMKRSCSYICSDCRRSYKVENAEKIEAYQKVYRAEHLVERKDYDREYKRVYQKENRGKVNAMTAKRRAAKLERTPPWLTKQHFADIQAFYDWADYLNGPHEVDHVVPLQGKNVSGLHVPWNLQVLSKEDHAGKGNKHVS